MLSVWKKRKGIIQGMVRCSAFTKQMIGQIKPGEIPVISHSDIDEVTARCLIQRKVKAVINCAPSFTGNYCTRGACVLLEHNIPLYECQPDANLLLCVQTGDDVTIEGNYLFDSQGRQIARLMQVTLYEWQEKQRLAEEKKESILSAFIDNTLEYASREKAYFIKPLPTLPLNTRLEGRDAVVVVRGMYDCEDFKALRTYIHDVKPALIGVDGGADILLENGLKPDIIVGDMDSVCDDALKAATDIVVHAYVTGEAPGERRLRSLNLPYHLLAAPGTSEDLGLLLAYENNARLIVSIGSHTSMIDFLEKGRKGMASTCLVRMKIGSRLVDARGISQLYPPYSHGKQLIRMWGGLGFPALLTAMFHPVFRHGLSSIWVHFKGMFGG
ncbi:putative cytokinetic ring protein SteA [Aneurinibacillus sp. Ricciae_BoGa-3]|uniref:putative cytokinetic ring protein SteA n=1 Tax=Aneurinibacillus sp. Ricciae_BoGa-3 TaxID=3022697 RepID=UPI00233FA612|nr:putative cytokinetic ring protein SteA [Aneurinibacillus sp. Ricciae_BoGa-3]WCK55936.1 putative cytokinetic ring protein SteA [Aneurinibacillus sp. Ricciae_BoGa-3]